MSTRTRLVNLIALVALLGFMFAASSCTGPTATKYTAATGITPAQTALLAGKWWVDYEQAKTANEILRTQASPVTSTKEVIEGVNPQASAPPSDDQRHGESDTHPERQSPKAPAPRRGLPKSRVNQESSAQMLASLGRHGPDRHPAAPGDQQTLAAEPQLPAPAIIVPIILHGDGESPACLFPERAGHQVPHARQSRTPGLPTSAVLGVEVIGADDLPAL